MVEEEGWGNSMSEGRQFVAVYFGCTGSLHCVHHGPLRDQHPAAIQPFRDVGVQETLGEDSALCTHIKKEETAALKRGLA